MPSFTQLPDAQSGTNEWSASTGTDFVDIVDEDDDSTYIYETRSNQEITYTTANPAIVEGDIDFNEDVTVTPRIFAHHTGSGTVNLDIQVTGTLISIPAATKAIANDSSFPLYAGNSTTFKSFGNDWDYSALRAAQIKLECKSNLARFQTLRVSFIYLHVNYSKVLVVKNATFFGANF